MRVETRKLAGTLLAMPLVHCLRTLQESPPAGRLSPVTSPDAEGGSPQSPDCKRSLLNGPVSGVK